MRLRVLVPHPSDRTLFIVPLTKGHVAIVSAVDAAAIGRFNWAAMKAPKTVYAYRTARRPDGSRTTEYLHQAVGRRMRIVGIPELDHRDGDGLNCRRSNLRPASRNQNEFNKRPSRVNRSGWKGVRWVAARARWRVSIDANGRRHELGSFVDKAKAVAVAVVARRRLHGEFARA